MVNKLITYLGFANKSGKLLFGVDNIEAKAKDVKIAIYDSTLSENSKNKLKNISARANFPIYLIDGTIDELLNKANCKVLGITSKDLAKAIEELNILKEVRN